MINVRYHLAALSAVFLAIAVGVVLGTVVTGGSASGLSDGLTSMRHDNAALRDKVDHLESKDSKHREFTAQVAGAALRDTLRGQRVAVLAVDGAKPSQVRGVARMLDRSQATKDGQLTLAKEFTSPNSSNELLDLAAKLIPKGFEPPNDNDGVETVSALLAASIMAKSGVSATDRDKLTSALDELDMANVDKPFSRDKVTAVVIVTGAGQSKGHNATVLTCAEQFARTAPVVLASPGPVSAAPVAEVVRDKHRAAKISTIDNIMDPEGQLATVLALDARVHGHVGHYGTGPGTTAAVPETP
ncbi:MAG TPA: copper transporter [Stackebrandtia sp.]|uniref:copper transporter n=1 Tax=Stackebrandtia sp. TaxID=2023065 RepID=UPI002D42C47B|nr:copper transporter [Stackebrandtia sp.]HZE38143.1 copper transporter [Stackebrandtia sp.]